MRSQNTTTSKPTVRSRFSRNYQLIYEDIENVDITREHAE